MKKLFLFCLFFVISLSSFAQYKPEIAPYVDFLKGRKLESAKDYILSKFQEHDLIILCERDHRDFTQYDLILDVLKDHQFVNEIGVIFTEVGAQTLNPELNNFLKSKGLSEEEVMNQIMDFQRNCANPIWEKPNFSHLVKGIYDINQKLPDMSKIEMYPTDVMSIDGEICILYAY